MGPGARACVRPASGGSLAVRQCIQLALARGWQSGPARGLAYVPHDEATGGLRSFGQRRRRAHCKFAFLEEEQPRRAVRGCGHQVRSAGVPWLRSVVWLRSVTAARRRGCHHNSDALDVHGKMSVVTAGRGRPAGSDGRTEYRFVGPTGPGNLAVRAQNALEHRVSKGGVGTHARLAWAQAHQAFQSGLFYQGHPPTRLWSVTAAEPWLPPQQ